MNLPLSTIENTFYGNRYAVPKLAKNVLYICLETGCGCRVVNESVVVKLKGRYTKAELCPDCGVVLWKIIK